MVPRLPRGYPCTRVTHGITRGWRVPVPEYPLGTGDGLRKIDGYPYPWVFTRVAPYPQCAKSNWTIPAANVDVTLENDPDDEDLALDYGSFELFHPSPGHPIHQYHAQRRILTTIPISEPPSPDGESSADEGPLLESSFCNIDTSFDVLGDKVPPVSDSNDDFTDPMVLLKSHNALKSAKAKNPLVTPVNRPRPRPKGTPHPNRIKPTATEEVDLHRDSLSWSPSPHPSHGVFKKPAAKSKPAVHVKVCIR